MKTLILLFIAFTTPISFAYADNCRLNPNDIFEPKGEMPSGKFKGRCLRTMQRRPLYSPTPQELKSVGFDAELDAGKVVVANVSHQDQFVLAEIPVKSIHKVTFQLERFPPEWIAAHTQLRFDFAEPINLKNQIDGKTSVGQIKAMVFTVEAIPQVNGPTYDLVKGTKGYYGLVHRLTSLDQKYKDVVLGEKNQVEQYRLNLTPEQGQNLFQLILKNHSSKEITSLYHTLKANCTNILFLNLDELLSKKAGVIKRFKTTVPVLSPGVLVKMGLIPSPQPNEINFNYDSSGLSLY